MRPALSALLLAACMPPGYYRLEPLPIDEPEGNLHHEISVGLRYEPHQGWDLEATVALRSVGQGRPRVDLSRFMIRVDGGPWEACNHPDGIDLEALIFVLQPGQSTSHTLTCLDIRRPYGSLEVRFQATGAGAGGAVQEAFDGVSAPPSIQRAS